MLTDVIGLGDGGLISTVDDLNTWSEALKHGRILKLCREAGFPEADLAADQFYMLLEGAKACVTCIGLRRVGEHLMRSVDALIAARRRQSQAPRASSRR